MTRLDAVANAFGLGTPLDVVPVARGAMGRIFRLTTSTGTFAVKELFWPTEESAVRREVALCDAAVRAGVRAPRSHTTADGRYVHDGWRVFDWVPGRSMEPAEPGRAMWVGHVLGTIHALRMTGGEADPWYSTAPSDDRWAELLDRGAGQPWELPLRAALPDLRDLATLVRPADPATSVLSHGDIQPANVLVNDDGFHLLDWENAGPMDPGRELAGQLLTWHVRNGVVDAGAIAQTVAAYRAAGGHGVLDGMDSFAGVAAGHLNYIDAQASVSLEHDDPEMRAHAAAEACATIADPPTVQSFEQILAATA